MSNPPQLPRPVPLFFNSTPAGSLWIDCTGFLACERVIVAE